MELPGDGIMQIPINENTKRMQASAEAEGADNRHELGDDNQEHELDGTASYAT